MSKRRVFGIAAVLAVAATSWLLSVPPAVAQLGEFRILQPAPVRVQSGVLPLRWSDPNQFEEDATSITWYYSRTPDGQDRKRVVSFFRDDFSRKTFRQNWHPQGPFRAEWAIRTDRDRGRVLVGGKGGGPCSSWGEVSGNVAVSLLVRPHGPRNEFGLGVKTDQDGSGYYCLSDGQNLKLVKREEQDEVLASTPLGDAAEPGHWYWYEVSVRYLGRGMKACELRARVFDEKHERVLVNCKQNTRCTGKHESGAITLLPPADFGELYVDPWEARWAAGGEGQFTWDTSGVEPGKYYLIAELTDCKRRRAAVSSFAMEVPGADRAAQNPAQ
jgi:hypothetical protein